MGTILILLGIYILYKFIVDFIIPIYKTSKRVQKQFRAMNQQMNKNAPGDQKAYNPPPSGYPGGKPVSKDYIEFEEIKE